MKKPKYRVIFEISPSKDWPQAEITWAIFDALEAWRLYDPSVRKGFIPKRLRVEVLQ